MSLRRDGGGPLRLMSTAQKAKSVERFRSWQTSFRQMRPRFPLTLHVKTSQMTESFGIGIAPRAAKTQGCLGL